MCNSSGNGLPELELASRAFKYADEFECPFGDGVRHRCAQRVTLPYKVGARRNRLGHALSRRAQVPRESAVREDECEDESRVS